jgi:hypothetical protein
MYENNRDQEMIDTIITLEKIAHQMGELASTKEELNKRLREMIGQAEDFEGSRTYSYDKWSLKVTTGRNYKLNKDEYEANINLLPKCFDPVKFETKIKLNEKIIRDVYQYGSNEENMIISKFISYTPSKTNIVITNGITGKNKIDQDIAVLDANIASIKEKLEKF